LVIGWGLYSKANMGALAYLDHGHGAIVHKDSAFVYLARNHDRFSWGLNFEVNLVAAYLDQGHDTVPEDEAIIFLARTDDEHFLAPF